MRRRYRVKRGRFEGLPIYWLWMEHSGWWDIWTTETVHVHGDDWSLIHEHVESFEAHDLREACNYLVRYVRLHPDGEPLALNATTPDGDYSLTEAHIQPDGARWLLRQPRQERLFNP